MPIDYRKNEIIKHIRSLIEVNHVDTLKAVEYATHTYIIPPLEQLEFERRIKGAWFLNNGKPTYITGNHYYYLQWCKIDIGYPDYWDRDRRFFLIWDGIR